MSTDISKLRTSIGTDREEINRILTQLQQLAEKSAIDALKEFIAFAPHIRSRKTTITTGSPHTTRTDQRNRETTTMKRLKPRPSNSYPLIHTTTGTISWQASEHKLGGNGIFDSSFVTVSDYSFLNPTTKITIACWIKPKAATSDGIIIQKNNQYELKLQNSNQIAFRVYSGGAWKTPLTYDYTPDDWVHIVAVYDSVVGQKLYINGTLSSSDSSTGAINTTVNDLKIGGDGTSNLPANTALSWLTIISDAVSTTWVTNLATNDLLDTKTYSEILTIPFVGDESPEPNATSGLFESGT